MIFSLEGQVALVTGAGQGIGKAIVERLASLGADVVVSDVNITTAQATAEGISATGRKAIAVATDVTDVEQVKETIGRTLALGGRVDILVNNAGITRDMLLLRMREEDWDAVLAVNLKGVFHCIKAVLPAMTKQRRGRIINIASIVGVIGNIGQANYAASKGAVIGLTKTVAREYASRGITANAVAPGFIDTAMTAGLPQEARARLMEQIPLARLGTPEDVSAAVAFLASEEAGYITGQVLHVNGGMYTGG